MSKTDPSPLEIPKNYEPKQVEDRVYAMWEKGDYFKPRESKTGENFSIVIPPPNVTGNLHAGHAVGITIQDALIRYHRMKGDSTLWVPGTDHAGISTQVVVEKKIAEQGKTRHDYTREQFVKIIWEWVEKYKKEINNQTRSMGASADWSRERFTFDDKFNSAVNKIFCDWYKKGLIYKGDYIVNWCNRCATVLSDIEAVPTVQESKLYNIRYFVKAADKSIIVATTRPETMLGDVAVAVHPADKRYKEYHDKVLILPIMNKEIPVITDERVDMEFGTGAVKITPAHDMLDYEIARDHNLDSVSVIAKDGKMNKSAGKFAGLDTLQARQNIIEYLDNIGNLESIEDIESNVRGCERCGTVVEPMISKQWFVKTKELSDKAIAAVRKHHTTIVPERFEKEFMHWMENHRDWCISRQLWWGHQIPVYYKDNEMVVSENPPKGEGWVRDEDVLDTWFSSGLWPFVAFGWPEKNEDLAKFYPTSVLETGRDILTFWVSRMMLMSLEATGKTPFKHVYLHGLMRDENNQKMSKSKGNGIEPSVLQNQYGTDATRLMLVIGTTPGNDFIGSFTKAEGYRNFVNKLWNASRFIRMNMESTAEYDVISATLVKNYSKLSLSQKWILSRLASQVRDFTASLEQFSFGDAGARLYEHTWGEFCDWYIEISKVEQQDPHTQLVLQYGILTLLKLWHPFAPFVTEEIWTNFEQAEKLIISSWPKVEETFLNESIERDFEMLTTIVKEIRNIRAERNVLASKEIEAVVVADTKEELFKEFLPVIQKLARMGEVTFVKKTPEMTKKVVILVPPFEVYLPLEGMIDIAEEKTRLEKKLADQAKTLRILNEKLVNDGFLAHAPEELLIREQKKRDDAARMVDMLTIQLGELA